jgi:hypothetical protein
LDFNHWASFLSALEFRISALCILLCLSVFDWYSGFSDSSMLVRCLSHSSFSVIYMHRFYYVYVQQFTCALSNL